MATFGYSFKPWTSEKTIAPKSDILRYLWDTVHEFGLEKHIRFGTNVTKAAFSSAKAQWTIEVASGQCALV